MLLEEGDNKINLKSKKQLKLLQAKIQSWSKQSETWIMWGEPMELQAHGAEGEEGGAEGEDHQDGENPNADDAEEEKDGEEDREQEGGEEIYENIREMTINLLLISNHEEQAEAVETGWCGGQGTSEAGWDRWRGRGS